jgi:hypothetical protein
MLVLPFQNKKNQVLDAKTFKMISCYCHRSHIHAFDNNVAVEENFQRRFSVNVWCGIFGDRMD